MSSFPDDLVIEWEEGYAALELASIDSELARAADGEVAETKREVLKERVLTEMRDTYGVQEFMVVPSG